MNLLHNACIFTKAAHGDQVRKYTGVPYWEHPFAVAHILLVFGICDENLQCGAILHDVVEDTDITIKDISNVFGEKIAELVYDLTNVSVKKDGDRKTRKLIDAEHIWNGSNEAQMVKCADLIDNTRTIVQYDPGFAWTYLREKRTLLDGMHYMVQEQPIWYTASILCDTSYGILKKWKGNIS